MGFVGDLVAHIKFTVLLMPNGSDRVTSHSLQELQPTKTIEDPEIKAWLALGVKSKKKGGGKKKKGEFDSINNKQPDLLRGYSNEKLNISFIFESLCFKTHVNAAAAKKGEKAEESSEAEPMDATTGAEAK